MIINGTGRWRLGHIDKPSRLHCQPNTVLLTRTDRQAGSLSEPQRLTSALHRWSRSDQAQSMAHCVCVSVGGGH